MKNLIKIILLVIAVVILSQCNQTKKTTEELSPIEQLEKSSEKLNTLAEDLEQTMDEITSEE